MADVANLAWTSELPYGFSDFKEDAFSRYKPRNPAPMIREREEVQCCIAGCEYWLPRARKGLRHHACPQHGIAISASPTYIFQNPKRNFIIGHDLLDRIKKVERWRLGNETSEDALTWNVFVSLLALGGLAQAFQMLTGFFTSEEPELYLWGNCISSDCSKWSELCKVRNELGENTGIPTEPDIVLRIPGQAVVLIEAKFGSGNGTFERKENRFGSCANFLRRYRAKDDRPDPLNRKWIVEQSGPYVREQLCRNVVFAQWLASDAEQPVVINLVRRAAADDEQLFRQHLSGQTVQFHRRTWENFFTLPVIQTGPATVLNSYLRNKTLRLQRAFES